MSDFHPAYHNAPPALRWPVDGDPAELWRVLNAAVQELPADTWAARVLPTGTIVTLRISGGVRELRIREPDAPKAERLALTAHSRWALELDALRTAFGVRAWDRLEPDGEAVHYVDRPRVVLAGEPVVLAVTPAPPQPRRVQVRQPRVEQIGFVLEEAGV